MTSVALACSASTSLRVLGSTGRPGSHRLTLHSESLRRQSWCVCASELGRDCGDGDDDDAEEEEEEEEEREEGPWCGGTSDRISASS